MYNVLPIRNAIVMLTNQCNCACTYCFEDRNVKCMSLDTAKDILNYLHANHVQNSGFTFFGGESMLEWDSVMVPLIEYAKTLDVPTRFAMTTNGTLFTREKLDYLYQTTFVSCFPLTAAERPRKQTAPCGTGRTSLTQLWGVPDETRFPADSADGSAILMGEVRLLV